MATLNLNQAPQLTEDSSFPPGPRGPRPLMTVLFMTARQFLAPRWQRRYGDMITVRIALGRTAVLVGSQELIKEVFAGKPSVFHAGEGNDILAPIMGPNSVLTMDDEPHLRARKQLMPAFNGAALRGYQGMMTELAEQAVERFPTGRAFATHPLMNGVTLEIILRVVFGMAEGDRLRKLRPALRRVVSIGPIAVMGWTYPKLERHWPWRRNREALDAVNELLYAEIAQRRTEPDLASRTDVLSQLITADPDVPDAELRDHMMTLLLAGHETTATALAWSLLELAHHPAIQRKAREAADTDDDEYLTAVVKEAMRLRPVIYTVARRIKEPVSLGGYNLPKGTIVAPCIGLVQRNPAHYPEPGEFRPERFIGKGPESGTWIPFGGGVRRCIGAGFSLQEAAAVLKAVLRRYELAPAGKMERQKSRNITLIPSNGARVIARERPSR
ncbi:cytochrome P450 [Labedaea rhizosphaerae]|uniref:Cytochrome P450 n=1 Tax=Labedaea rhizosphaerae TaxID=598644 RepID=A0A4R6SB73_LABRH|nr:cytochrome P450 [Labedaea rhizosphaerae]TDP97172.1 cytochrome P450 [Labedaea rhizosphaerae]